MVERLSKDDARLLTLTGPGGTGKTRLAVQAAGMASEDYPDGIFWVPLAPLRAPSLVLATAGQILGSKSALAEHIADRRMLCLFDNFEQSRLRRGVSSDARPRGRPVATGRPRSRTRFVLSQSGTRFSEQSSTSSARQRSLVAR